MSRDDMTDETRRILSTIELILNRCDEDEILAPGLTLWRHSYQPGLDVDWTSTSIKDQGLDRLKLIEQIRETFGLPAPQQQKGTGFYMWEDVRTWAIRVDFTIY